VCSGSFRLRKSRGAWCGSVRSLMARAPPDVMLTPPGHSAMPNSDTQPCRSLSIFRSGSLVFRGNRRFEDIYGILHRLQLHDLRLVDIDIEGIFERRDDIDDID